MDEEVRFVTANGVRFGYFERGDGPLVLMIHGFPDNAWKSDGFEDPTTDSSWRVSVTRRISSVDIASRN